MDVQDQITHATSLPSAHEGHGVHLCHRCGWPFPNPHPSSKQRRSHKRHCGTIEGYAVLSGAEAVSDEDHHADTDKEKSPSPKIEKKTSIGVNDGGDGLRASISRSEDEFFSDAGTEFSDGGPRLGGPVKKSLDKDLFYSFNNGGTNEVLNAPIVVTKVDAIPEVTEKPVTDLEKIAESEITTPQALSESKLELTEPDEKCADGLVKAETIEAVKAAEEKVEESQTSEVVTEEVKDSEVTKTSPEVCEKIESEAVKEPEVNLAKVEKIESDRELVPEEVSETDKKVPVFIEKEDLGEHIQEVVNKLDTVMTEQSDVDAPESAKCSEEQIQEVVKELGTVLNEKENPDAAEFVKFLKDQVHDDAAEKENLEEPKLENRVDPDAIWTEKPDLDAPIVEKTLKENIPEETPLKSDSVLTEKLDLDAPIVEKTLKENVPEEPVLKSDSVLTEKEDLESPVVEKTLKENTPEEETLLKSDPVLTEKLDLESPIVEKTLKENVPEEPVLKSDLVLTEKEDLDEPRLEKCAKENAPEVIEQKVDDESNVVADVTAEKIAANASGVAPEQKSVDSSSLNSLDGNWGSVLSTASVDAESTEKPKVNPTKPVVADCLVEPEVKDSKPEPCPEDLTKLDNESDAKKSTPLKNLLGEAKSPSAKNTDHAAKTEEGEPMSPPKLIEDGKKERKKVKGVRSWVPFGCCSSVNVVN